MLSPAVIRSRLFREPARTRIAFRSRFRWSMALCLALLCAAAAFAFSGQSFTTLVSFDGANGAYPAYASLAQGFDGNFYGVTKSGGANDAGTVYRLRADGSFASVYSFCPQNDCAKGLGPSQGLVVGSDGNFYGTAQQGGSSTFCGTLGCGTVYRMTPAGQVTLLHSFDSADGRYPFSRLVEGSDGNFYGTTIAGGLPDGTGSGTIFRISPAGEFHTFYVFTGKGGASPGGALIQGSDGYFYGTTSTGGAHFIGGTVYRISPAGAFSTLHSFCAAQSNGICQDGANPYAGVIEGADGNYYGTTEQGGLSAKCQGGCGVIFKVTPQGMLTLVHSFDLSDGGNIEEPLLQATDGNFYGTASTGGAVNSEICNTGGLPGCGTIFRITRTGTFSVLHNFQPDEGANPFSGLLQATNGQLYGATDDGGLGQGHQDGAVFSLGIGLAPFVSLVPASGAAGAAVDILGGNFIGVSSVTFNGVAAAFTVVSQALITTTVPAGAASGRVQVVTPGRTLTSNVAFRVER